MRSIRTAAILAAIVSVAVLVFAGPAGANVSVSGSLTVPVGVAVGQTGVAGSISFSNTNTAPNQAESNTLISLRLAPSCGSAPAPPNPCPTPDPGVIAITAATGAAGTLCAGVVFSISAPDAAGIVTLTPSSPVVLGPPGGPNSCTVNFTFNVLKVPAIDVNPGTPGVQTFFNARVAVQSPGGLMPAIHPSAQITVARAQPGMTTQASPSVPLGGTVFDTATVTGVAGVATPTGTVTFNLYGPNDSTCAGLSLTSTNPLVNGVAQSNNFVPMHPGVYRFTATYSGDANYNSFSSGCNAPNESVSVFPRRPVADFDGDGRTDLAVFRPSTGQWFADGTLSDLFRNFGVSTDIPAVGDYDGDGKADVAVFRPSTGVWFIQRSSGGSQALPFGAFGDIPVPADYDGDGLTDRAVFRPSTGTWFIRHATAGPDVILAYGTNGDVPVAGDYDGDRKADIAVYRPSTGQWFVHRSSGGDTFTAWGTGGDIPVPGDYDGDGRTDQAVFRPSTGTWFLNRSTLGPTSSNWGISTDIPVPGDYDGDGKTDLVVFRKSSGVWFEMLSSGGFAAPAWGTNGDVTVALPPGIHAILPP